MSKIIAVTKNTTKIHTLHPCIKLLIKTTDNKMHQSNDYENASVFTPLGMISLDNNLQVGTIILLTLPEMLIL